MTTTTSPLQRLTSQQYRHYWQHGYLILHKLLDASTVQKLTEECDRLLARNEGFRVIPEAGFRLDASGKPVCDRLDPVIPHSQFIAKVARDAAIMESVADLFGESPKLLRDKVIFKPPGVSGYGLHHDHAYWDWMGVPAHDTMSVMISVDKAERESGPLIVYGGYHDSDLPRDKDEPRDIDPAAVDESRAVWCMTEPGDAVLFHARTPHRSERNQSAHARRVLYLVYNAGKHGDLYADYQQRRFASV